MGSLILFVFIFCLLWLFYHDGKERASVSPAAWIVVAWAVLHGTRPVTSWFAAVDPELFRSESRDEGNPGEAFINFVLIIAGLIVCGRRGIRLSTVIRDNKWLLVFYLFWIMSIMWSDYPLITFKRLFKDLGNVIMVLVILTERSPGEAIRGVCIRLTYAAIPLSIVMYKYFPGWGRAYVGYKHDVQMFVGVASHKNTLGVLALVGAVFLLWDFIERRGKQKSLTGNILIASRSLVLLMCWYLLLKIDSVTSLICAVFGTALLIALSVPSIRRSPWRLEVLGVGSVMVLWLFNSMFDIKAAIFQIVGRNETLTTRTDIWPILIDSQDSPLLGAGFNTFWAGERQVLLEKSVGGIIQAHNGYLETYLNGGLVGVALLLILLLLSYVSVRKQLVAGTPEGSIRYVILLMALIYNNSEASFSKVGLLWLVTLFAIIQYRSAQPPLRQEVRTATVFPFAGSPTRTVETP